MNNLTLGSLFSGSGGFELGGLISGITPSWSSEVEPFPIRVTKKRLPFVKHLGDISKINGAEIEPVDIITFGSPCQNLSIAGNRDGLTGEKSSLFYEAIRIIKEMRCETNGKYPRFIVWENVLGAYSSNKGEDFKAVLEEICQIKDECVSIPKSDKWRNAGEIVGNNFSVAWRTLDAQFWGVPQRRKRIYLVADFADQCAGKILFESEGVSGYSSKGIGSWEGTTTDFETCVGETSNSLMFENHGQDCRYKGPLDVSQTVSSTFGTGGNNQPFVVEDAKTFDVRFTSENTKVVRHNVYETDTSRTIDTGGNSPESNQGGIAVVALQGSMIGRSEKNGPQGSGINEGVSFTLNSTDKHAVVYALDRASFNAGQNYARTPGISTDGINSTLVAHGPSAVGVPTYCTSKNSHHTIAEEELANTLVASDYKDPPIINAKTVSGKDVFGTLSANVGEKQWLGNQEAFSGDYHIMEQDYIVRRLTPTECARLQGFPDWWCSNLETENPTEEDISFWSEVFETQQKILGKSTKPKSEKQIIKWLQNPHSDSAAYKMWGNGVALSNVVFVLSGITYYSQK